MITVWFLSGGATSNGHRLACEGGTMKHLFQTTFASSLALLALSSPAWAIYNQSAIITDKGSSVPATSISFVTPDGTTIPVEEDEDEDDRFFILFPGDEPTSGTLLVRQGDGSLLRIPVPEAGPDETLQIDVGRGIATSVPPSAYIPSSYPKSDIPRLTLTAGGLYVGADIAHVGAGTVIGPNFGEPGNEEFVATRDGIIDMPLVSLGFNYRLGDAITSPNLSGLLAFGGGDESVNASVPEGTESVGIVYHDFSPSGSTGVFLGPAGLDVALDQEVEFFKARLVYDHSFGWDVLDKDLRPRIGLQFHSVTQDVFSTAWSPEFGQSVLSTTRQELDENVISLILGIGGTRYPSSGTGFSTGFTADALIYHYDRDLYSLQSNICGVCPFSDQAFDILIEESDKGIDIGAEIGGHFSYVINNSWTIGLQGKLQYLPSVGQIANTRTGDDLFVRNQPTTIGDEDALSYGGGIALSFSF